MTSKLEILSVETILVDVPTIRPHKLSVATMNHQTLVLVRIATSDGIVGWGEGTTIGGLAYGEESPESIKTNLDTYVAPLLKGQDPRGVARLMATVSGRIQGNRFAKCALETALYDNQARRLGVPLSEHFGGRVRDSIPVAWTLASGDTQRDIAEAQVKGCSRATSLKSRVAAVSSLARMAATPSSSLKKPQSVFLARSAILANTFCASAGLLADSSESAKPYSASSRSALLLYFARKVVKALDASS